MKRIALLVTMLVLGRAAWAMGALADVTVYDRTEGGTLTVYSHEGKYFIAGKPGNRYQISIRNQGGDDVLAVASVDGVNVVSGETANWNQTGYVLGAAQTTQIKGWRKDQNRVAAFYFTELGDSYAARTGRPGNVGVIGVALFRRKVEPVAIEPYWNEDRRERDAAPQAPNQARPSAAQDAAPAAKSGAQAGLESKRAAPAYREDKKIGTGHGASEHSSVRYVDFERASEQPDEVITLYYDSYRNLLAQGVIPHARVPAVATPFPGQFVPDPPRNN
jgi:hypothetical protein